MSNPGYPKIFSTPILDVVVPVRNNAEKVSTCIRSILHQAQRYFRLGRVFVVDDASDDDTFDTVDSLSHEDERIELVRSEKNLGRSGARNLGACRSRSELLAFFDSDCCLDGNYVLEMHVEKMKQGADLSYGKILSRGNEFWDRYMRLLSESRKRHRGKDSWLGFTSANFAIKRSFFEEIGGFDPKYKRYGFEDRDLALRVTNAGGCIAYCSNAAVYHETVPSLTEISLKMSDAAAYSAKLFYRDHPNEYSKLVYSRFDARWRAWLNPVGLVLGPVLPGIALVGDKVCRSTFAPYWLKTSSIKITTAASYVVGSTKKVSINSPPT